MIKAVKNLIASWFCPIAYDWLLKELKRELAKKDIQVVGIKEIKARGKRMHVPNCTFCGSRYVLNRKPHVWLFDDGVLLVIGRMQAYRCSNEECSGSILMPGEVRNERREVIIREKTRLGLS